VFCVSGFFYGESMTTVSTNAGRIVKYYGTGAAALSETVSPGDGYRILAVMLHLSAAPTTAESVTVTFDSSAGSSYDTILNSQGMAGVTDYVWMPSNDLYLVNADALAVAFTNTDTNTWGLTVLLENV
jgi:hypothetical protein